MTRSVKEKMLVLKIKKMLRISSLILSIILIQNIKAQFKEVNINYFGQTPPGNKAVVFAPDFICRDGWYVQNCSFSQNGKEFVFVRTDSAWNVFSLMYTHYENGKWTEPVELFPGEKNLGMPFFSYNDSIIYFSNSLVDIRHDGDIYISKRSSLGWTKPEKFSSPVNSDDGSEWEISEARNGTLYFSSTRKGARTVDNYLSKPENGKYIHVENLGEPVNTVSADECPYISPDESFLIFNSWRYNPKFLGNNFYISYKNNNGTWSDMKDLGEKVNTNDLDIYPYITPDGKYFMFTRRSYLKNDTYSKIYWISTEFLNKIKKSKDFAFKPLSLSSDDLDKYLGVYSNPKIPFKIEISKTKNTLKGKSTGQPEFEMDAIGKDLFSPGGYILKFTPEKNELIVSNNDGSEIGRFTKEK